jgi:hypothetical protein
MGSDFPPPVNFYKVVIYILIVDIFQLRYLDYFINEIESRKIGSNEIKDGKSGSFKEKKETFLLKHLVYSLFFSLLVAIFPLFYDIKKTLDKSIMNNLIWIVVVTAIGLIYSAFFYLFNKRIILKGKKF